MFIFSCYVNLVTARLQEQNLRMHIKCLGILQSSHKRFTLLPWANAIHMVSSLYFFMDRSLFVVLVRSSHATVYKLVCSWPIVNVWTCLSDKTDHPAVKGGEIDWISSLQACRDNGKPFIILTNMGPDVLGRTNSSNISFSIIALALFDRFFPASACIPDSPVQKWTSVFKAMRWKTWINPLFNTQSWPFWIASVCECCLTYKWLEGLLSFSRTGNRDT